jgi:predicted alpha/beta superfamily hydrolase
MKKNIFFLFFTISVFSQDIKVTSGKIQKFDDFKSNYVDARTVAVWLPEAYSKTEKYAVLYMHDGQMLFDSTTTWNKQEWKVDEVASKLMATKQTKKFIVVGIWNNGQKRHSEYFPQKPYESLTQIERDTITAQLKKKGRTTTDFLPISDLYLKFLVTELKPFIDKTFSTRSDKKNTYIMGSSMGGLISMYAICEYPEIFGGAACLSTHWVGTFSPDNNPIPDAFVNYLKRKLPNPKNHKFYFDYGDKTLDAMYPKFQKMVDAVLVAKGFTDKNWLTKFFPGEDHSEKSWSGRLDVPLEFMLKE